MKAKRIPAENYLAVNDDGEDGTLSEKEISNSSA